jgi:hypothetical protein
MAKNPHFGGMLKKELAIWEEEANLAMSYRELVASRTW